MATITDRIRAMHGDLKLDYGSYWDEDANKAAKRTLENMAVKYGIDRLEKAVASYRENPHKNFDKNSLEGFIPPATNPTMSHPWNCPLCPGDGWVKVPQEGKHYMDWPITRCPNWRAA